MFFTASLVYLPFAFKYPGISLVYYSPFQLFILLTSAVILLIFFAIDVLQEKGYWKKIGLRRDDASSLIVLVLGIFALSVIFVMFPNVIKSVIGVVTPGAYGRTIAEVQPFFIENGEFSLYRAWDQFSITFFFAIPAIIYLIYKLYRERGECHLFILIWSVAMLVALAGQIRFAYYFGAVSAVLSGVMVEVILEKIGFYRFKEAEVSRSKKGKKKYKKGVDYSKLISGILILLITLFPTASSAYSQSSSSTLIASHSTINDDWYETLKWMREYTPNGSFYDSFYYQSYETSKGERYPSDAYGVMSWWDYGHWITAIAHRIPNANPFQQGAKTASLFFTAMNESEASEILNELGSKYVITDIEMASLKYGAIRVWAEDEEGYFKIVNVSLFNHTIGLPFNSEKFYSTTLGRLHYLDGNGLENFRLIHESENYVVTYKVANLGTGRIDTVMFKGNYSEALNFYLQLRNNPSLMSLGNSYAILYDPTPPSSYVKIFEYVKGGVIKGTATQTVKISATIETNNGRTFQYIQTIEPVNGYYEVRVPYSSTMPYDVKIIGDYTVKSGGVVKHVSFTEEEIQKGVTKTVNF
jgi:dolichyl-diphosphooligosaccharide--protein glycosyltransferase